MDMGIITLPLRPDGQVPGSRAEDRQTAVNRGIRSRDLPDPFERAPDTPLRAAGIIGTMGTVHK